MSVKKSKKSHTSYLEETPDWLEPHLSVLDNMRETLGIIDPFEISDELYDFHEMVITSNQVYLGVPSSVVHAIKNQKEQFGQRMGLGSGYQDRMSKIYDSSQERPRYGTGCHIPVIATGEAGFYYKNPGLLNSCESVQSIGSPKNAIRFYTLLGLYHRAGYPAIQNKKNINNPWASSCTLQEFWNLARIPKDLAFLSQVDLGVECCVYFHEPLSDKNLSARERLEASATIEKFIKGVSSL